MERDCTFCQIVKGDKSADFVYQGKTVMAFRDIHPHAPIHILIVPIRHIRSINELTDDDKDIISDMIFVAKEMAEQHSIADSGYKLLFNVEWSGGQVIFHLHLHLLGGW